ncbi:MAG: PDZ domain-containing protein [Flavobacteriales bacterium]|nr:PDZ domain-containing protein [Flavobacteriales bacterium]
MTTPCLFLFPLAAVFQSAAPQQVPDVQTPTDRKVRIEIVTTENGETKRVTREFDAADDAQVEDALRELGVLEHMKLNHGEHDMTIDIRGFGEDLEDGDLFLHMAPMPPLPPDAPRAPHAPDAPMALVCEKTAYLGVSTQNLKDDLAKESGAPNGEGAYVIEVIDDTPASKLGLQRGDVIVAVEGEAVTGPGSLAKRVRGHEPGDKVKVTWYRKGRKMNGTAELAANKQMSYAYSFDGMDWDLDMDEADTADEPQAFLGVTPGEGEGAVIGSVEENSSAQEMGLRGGDVIRSVNGKAIPDFDALAETIGAMKPEDEVSIEVLRGTERLTLRGTLGEREDMLMQLHGMPGFNGIHFEGMSPADRDELRREMDKLRQEMNELRRDLGRDIRREVRINIETRKLSDEEKALLRGKGVPVDKELSLGDLRAFPNPSAGFYRLQFDLPERGDLSVDVHDAKGERVYQERIIGFKGRYERTLDLSDQASGNYFLVITQGGRTATQKLVKE